MYMISRESIEGMDNGIIKLSDKSNIPNDENNKDWQAYQVWLNEGNEPLAWNEEIYSNGEE